MNMISTGAFLNEMDASNKQPTVAEKFAAVWEKKNAKAARAGGVSLMALSLAACGSSSTTTTSTSTTDTSTTTGTTTTVTPVSSALTISNDNIDGTSSDDTVTGARIDTVQTWNSGDTIDLGAGTDSFSATISASVTPASLTGVENLTITALTNTLTVDMDNATGVSSITSTGSSSVMTVDDIQELPTSITVNNNSAQQKFVVKDAAAAGSADSITVNFDGAGAVVNIGNESDLDGGFETMIINASGGASDLGAGGGFGADATSITVNATAAFDMGSGDQFAKATTFDASASTAAVTVHLADRAAAGETAVNWSFGSGADVVDIDGITLANFGDIAVDMGAGNDKLTVGSKQDTDTGSSFDGGDGEDTLHVGSTPISSTAFAANVTNFEVLEFLTSGTDSQDMDLAAGMSIVAVSDAGAGTDDLNLTDVASGLEVRLSSTDLAGVSTNGDDLDILNIDLKADGASDSMTLKIGATGGNVQLGNFEPDTRFETVTVISSGTSANTIGAIDTAVNNMIFSGSGALTISSTNALTGVADFSAMTGVATVTSGTGALTVTGGSGDDVLTTGSATAGQTINGGAGDDMLSAGAIAGTNSNAIQFYFNGDAGSDTIDVSSAVGTSTATAVDDDVVIDIDGGTGIDFITLSTDVEVSHDVVSTATGVADADKITNFSSGTAATDDDFNYNGTLKNDSATTVTASSASTFAGALSADPDATVFIVTTALSGAAATDMTALVAETDVDGIIADYATFEASLVANLGTITGLDSTLSADETVLLNVDDGTNSVILRVTNTDTTVANTLTVAEVDLVAIMVAADDLVTADFA